jgi:hypothetical protein
LGRGDAVKAEDTGRMAFRHEWEYADGRPCIVYRYPFWRDESERLRYERAVSMCPVKEYGHMRFDEYLGEVVKVAEGIDPGTIREMPAASNWDGAKP